MSTYNGERYLPVQLDSILSQQGVDLDLFVRDDGSSDGTVPLLEEYERRGELVLFRGENLGYARSFLKLVTLVPPEYDYIAFSDQDDRWHPDKLERALSSLRDKNPDIPQLYCCDYYYCSADLDIEKPHLHDNASVKFNYVLFGCTVTGNTVVINRTLADRVIDAGCDRIYAHDWWVTLIAAAIGELTYDDFIGLDYRRLTSSTSLSGQSGLLLVFNRIRTFLVNNEIAGIVPQLARLSELFGAEMPIEKRKLLDRVVYGGRMKKLFTPVRLRRKLFDEIGLRVMFLIGKL